MNAVFVYLAIGAAIVGFADDVRGNDPFRYAATIALWPFIAITVAASMLRDYATLRAKDSSQ